MAVASNILASIRHPLTAMCQPSSRRKAYITAHGVGSIGVFTTSATIAHKAKRVRRLAVIDFMLITCPPSCELGRNAPIHQSPHLLAFLSEIRGLAVFGISGAGVLHNDRFCVGGVF
ncbi:hypothetical protein ES708_16913 [subsurface metagenome]